MQSKPGAHCPAQPPPAWASGQDPSCPHVQPLPSRDIKMPSGGRWLLSGGMTTWEPWGAVGRASQVAAATVSSEAGRAQLSREWNAAGILGRRPPTGRAPLSLLLPITDLPSCPGAKSSGPWHRNPQPCWLRLDVCSCRSWFGREVSLHCTMIGPSSLSLGETSPCQLQPQKSALPMRWQR